MVRVFHIEIAHADMRGGGQLDGHCRKTYVLLCRDVRLEGRSEMKGERIAQREVGWDRHDAEVERMGSRGMERKSVGWETRNRTLSVDLGLGQTGNGESS